MTTDLAVTAAPRIRRYDRTLRVVMWMDAFLSCAMVAVAVVATPIIATVGAPRGALLATVVIVCAVLLAAFGAITGVLLMVRMHLGQYFLPEGLHLPLPPGLNPELVTSARVVLGDQRRQCGQLTT